MVNTTKYPNPKRNPPNSIVEYATGSYGRLLYCSQFKGIFSVLLLILPSIEGYIRPKASYIYFMKNAIAQMKYVNKLRDVPRKTGKKINLHTW